MLKIKSLSKNYKDKCVLNKLDFEVSPGEIVALIGINGAGKSTLTETICGVKDCDEGVVIIDGMSIKDKKLRIKIKYTIGYMPQSFCLYNDLTVKENLEYLSSIYKLDIDVDKLMEMCLLKENADTIASNLSGGYRQLLSLAGAMVHSPKFLILDEPTSAMDPLFRKEFWKVLKEYNKQGNTILIITHYLEELLECKRFACLSKGRINYEGNVKDFKKKGFVNIEEVLNKFS